VAAKRVVRATGGERSVTRSEKDPHVLTFGSVTGSVGHQVRLAVVVQVTNGEKEVGLVTVPEVQTRAEFPVALAQQDRHTPRGRSGAIGVGEVPNGYIRLAISVQIGDRHGEGYAADWIRARVSHEVRDRALASGNHGLVVQGPRDLSRRGRHGENEREGASNELALHHHDLLGGCRHGYGPFRQPRISMRSTDVGASTTRRHEIRKAAATPIPRATTAVRV